MLCVTGVKLDSHVPIYAALSSIVGQTGSGEHVRRRKHLPVARCRSACSLGRAPVSSEAQRQRLMFSLSPALLGRITISTQCYSEDNYEHTF